MSAKEGRGVVCAGVVESICLGVSSATSREKEREREEGTVWVCYLPTVFLELSIPPFFSDTSFTLPAGNDPGSPSGK